MLNIFLFAILLIRFPPILLPFGLSTYIVFRAIIGILFFALLFINRKKFETTIFVKLSLLFFVSQSLSIINAINIGEFFYFFEKLVTVYLFLFTFLQLLNNKKVINNVIHIILFTLVFNTFLGLLVFFYPYITDILYLFIHPSVVDIMVFNLGRSRIFFEAYSEIFLPLVLYLYFFKSKLILYKIFLLILVIGIFLLAFFSNYRDSFLTAAVSYFGFLWIFYRDLIKINFKNHLITFLIFSLVLISGFFYINITKGYSVIDRLLLQDQQEDINSLTSRGRLINKAVDMTKKYPVFGVGLGNFYEHLSFDLKNQQYEMAGNNKTFFNATLLYPHNFFVQIMAETGIIGAFSFLIILVYFIKVDWRILKNDDGLNKSFVIAFWSLLFYASFNPRSALPFWLHFFLIRLLIKFLDKKT